MSLSYLQYHWYNQDVSRSLLASSSGSSDDGEDAAAAAGVKYSSFDEGDGSFLMALRQSKRKSIRQARRGKAHTAKAVAARRWRRSAQSVSRHGCRKAGWRPARVCLRPCLPAPGLTACLSGRAAGAEEGGPGRAAFPPPNGGRHPAAPLGRLLQVLPQHHGFAGGGAVLGLQ